MHKEPTQPNSNKQYNPNINKITTTQSQRIPHLQHQQQRQASIVIDQKTIELTIQAIKQTQTEIVQYENPSAQ